MSRKDTTPKNLTFGDFERLANRQPNLEGQWIYRLKQFFYDPDIENPYPKFELDYDVSRLFLSFDDAVKYLKGNIDNSFYCSLITQIPIGRNEYKYAAQWLFDSNGNMLDFTTTHTFGESIEASFFGIPRSRLRFSKGDIVEVIGRDEVSLAVVSADLIDPEWCWGCYQRGLKRYPDMPYGLDCTDEAVTVIYGPSYKDHDHVSPVSVLKPRFSIPKEIENEMRTWLNRAEEESLKERKEMDG